MSGVQLIRYDAMCTAIEQCYSVDEVKDYRDKAMALESYAKIAMNVEAERKACEVRLRAERRAGELFSELEKSKGGDPSIAAATVAGASPYRAALERTATPERTARRYQELAAVPKVQFDDALRGADKPSTNAILRAANGSTRMDDGSLWVWGRLRDFERDGYLKRSASDVYGGMTETMQADVQRILPSLLDWLGSLQELIQ
jgi:hypothetical protein